MPDTYTIHLCHGLVDRALNIARCAHRKQRRRNGNKPFVQHPIAVAKRVATYLTALNATEDTIRTALAVAHLHDVFEDSTLGRAALLEAGIPRDVLDLVHALTHDPATPYETYIDTIVTHPSLIVRIVKFADIVDNLGDAPRPGKIPLYTAAIARLAPTIWPW